MLSLIYVPNGNNGSGHFILKKLLIENDDLDASGYMKFDLIIANPPYIPHFRMSKVAKCVKAAEASSALFPFLMSNDERTKNNNMDLINSRFSKTGLEFYYKILSDARFMLRSKNDDSSVAAEYNGPRIAFEIDGAYQTKALIYFAKKENFCFYKFMPDFNNQMRSVFFY